MTRQITRRQRQMPLLQRQITRRSTPDWQYDYNYDDKKFLKYFRSRTGVQVGFETKRELSHFLLTSPKADHWLRTSKDYRYMKSKKMVPFGKLREDTIRWHKILRDKLQLWWKKYQEENQPRKIKRRRR